MSEYLSKDKILFERNEKSELVPTDAIVEYIENKPRILVKPITKGELADYISRLKQGETYIDEQIIVNHCLKPAFSLDEAKNIKYDKNYIDALLTAIMAISSGKSQFEMKEKRKGKDSDVENFTATE